MKIYAAADLHAKPQRLLRLKKNIFRHNPDLVILAGDITHFFNPQKTIDFLDQMDVPILAVRGNTDFKRVERRIEKTRNITLLGTSPLKIKDLSFSGTGGTLVLPFASRICFGENRVLEQLAQGLCPPCPGHVVVVHPPPLGILDRVGNKIHAGSRNLKRFIDAVKPGVLICGHIHEQPGIRIWNHTLVVNAAMGARGDGAVLDRGKNGKIQVKLLNPGRTNGKPILFNPRAPHMGKDRYPPPIPRLESRQKEKIMCESNVYLREKDRETLVMENVAAITPSGKNTFVLKGLLGERKEIKGVIEDINLMGHKIILKARN